ncbi:hypothetical protein NDU88_000250 [Pleurodeles waltl]|uniref:Uncharacterized protein n=1 Tax=Pleurodeles waltl TaxID=8319 RepID=A0AAV7P0B6_PLEWA|nr:hypothetical protein NDU88_000250 [Pleurodeles waltl]
MDGLKSLDDVIPPKDRRKPSHQMKRDKGDGLSARNCDDSMDWANIEIENSTIANHHYTALDEGSVCTSPFTSDTQNTIDFLRIEVETGPSTMDDQSSMDSVKKEAEHSIVDGQLSTALIRTEGESMSSPGDNQCPIKYVNIKVEADLFATDHRNTAKLVKIVDASELSSESNQNFTELVKVEAGEETYSEECQDSSCLMKLADEEYSLARDCLGDMDQVKTEGGKELSHNKSPGLIKWVMFKTAKVPFSRDPQDCEEGTNENCAAAVTPLPTKEKDAARAAVKPVCLRHPSTVFSGEIHCNGVARMVMLKPGQPAVSVKIAGDELQPLTLSLNTQESERIDELGAGLETAAAVAPVKIKEEDEPLPVTYPYSEDTQHNHCPTSLEMSAALISVIIKDEEEPHLTAYEDLEDTNYLHPPTAHQSETVNMKVNKSHSFSQSRKKNSNNCTVKRHQQIYKIRRAFVCVSVKRAFMKGETFTVTKEDTKERGSFLAQSVGRALLKRQIFYSTKEYTQE